MNTKRLPFAILKPVQTEIPTTFHVNLSQEDLEEFLANHDYLSDVMVLDIETKGNQVYSLDSTVVGFGLSDKRGAGYWTSQHWPTFLMLAYRYRPALIGHNISFDGAYAYRDGGDHLSWKYCTYGLYRHLASEGWRGQRWGLKTAQVDLLGWESANDGDLNKWLVQNGYQTASRKSLDGVVTTGDWYFVPEHNMWAKADKSQMYKAPPEILGKYCVLDCISTYLLFTLVMKPALEMFHVYHDFHKDVFINHVEIHIEQQVSGFEIDVDGFRAYEKKLESSIQETQAAFFQLDQVRDIIVGYNDSVVQRHLAKEPSKFKASQTPKEPAKYTKQGLIAKTWRNWKEKVDNPPEQEPLQRWLQWEQKRIDISNKQHFNPSSNKQLAWLFYDKLKYPPILFTKTDAAATSGKAMKAWGPAGLNLTMNSKMSKELGYVKGVLDYQRDGIVHPQFKVPGTLTGRLAGAGSLNVQQMPKSKDFLSLFKAREGHVWVDFDWTALEPSVLTELSRDPNMLKIYGPSAPKNDIYIFVGSAIPGIKEVFTKCGYNPDNPSKESIALIKKEHKVLRNVCKTLVLSAQYGAGPNKIHETLKLQGISKPIEEIVEIHQAYWKLYSGIKDYERFLRKMWTKNKGWVLNGIGRPMCVDDMYIKDIVNRCLGGNSLVFSKQRGLIELRSVTTADSIWDGVEFVSHEGLLQQGKRLTIELNGIMMTPDHDVLIGDEWKEACDVRVEDIQAAALPGPSWKTIWGLCNLLGREVAKGFYNICRRALCT